MEMALHRSLLTPKRRWEKTPRKPNKLMPRLTGFQRKTGWPIVLSLGFDMNAKCLLINRNLVAFAAWTMAPCVEEEVARLLASADMRLPEIHSPGPGLDRPRDVAAHWLLRRDRLTKEDGLRICGHAHAQSRDFPKTNLPGI